VKPSMRGTRREESPLRLNVGKVHIPLSALLFAWTARKVGQGAAWLARLLLHRPWLLAAGVGVWFVSRLVHGHGILATSITTALLAGVLMVWWWRWRESFTHQVVWRVRGWWRSWAVYRFTWQPAMVTTNLAVIMDGTQYLPRLVSVSSTGTVDRVFVRMLPGQVFDDWAAMGPRLAQTFGAQECRVRTTRHRQRLELWFLVADPLTDPVAPASLIADAPGRNLATILPAGAVSVETVPAITDSTSRSHARGGGDVDLTAVPVARCEDGTVYRLRLLGTHVLVVGATGSGKGSVVWSTLYALGPAIRDGVVAVWCLDPKGGMELAPGARLFARFVYGDPDYQAAHTGPTACSYELEFAQVLEDAVQVMRRRQATLRGKTRLHTPTVDEPLILVVVDEIASLTAYVVDRDAKRRIAAALSLLLSQGRAVGVTVIGAVQDPRKEILTVRDLFPTRIALRLSEPEHVALVLGQGARDRGARCDQISEHLPGIGYVGLDGRAEPVRIRFAHVTDDDIAQLCHSYAPRAVVHASTEQLVDHRPPLPAVAPTALAPFTQAEVSTVRTTGGRAGDRRRSKGRAVA
jgi:DNA segregation ATPase FtsK/SpoIIIE, S-DNA-T family